MTKQPLTKYVTNMRYSTILTHTPRTSKNLTTVDQHSIKTLLPAMCCAYSIDDTATVHRPPSDQRSQGGRGCTIYHPRFRSAAAGSHVVSRGFADRQFGRLRDPSGRRPAHAVHPGGVLRGPGQVHGQGGEQGRAGSVHRRADRRRSVILLIMTSKAAFATRATCCPDEQHVAVNIYVDVNI